jgi:hypothetical protein
MWQIRPCFEPAYAPELGSLEKRVPASDRPREWRDWLPQAEALIHEWSELHVSRSLSTSQVDDLTQCIARSLHRAFQCGQINPPAT